MINQSNFPALLIALGFKKHGARMSKIIGAATLEVDTARGTLIYPEAQGLTINERQTCNFSSSENFVVFECVHRLLEKGYLPQHIELEPKWKLGHGASGGRADILIRDNHVSPLLIIECKTAGGEFNRAWNKTLQDGDQLFSYAQQIPATQFLCLYASNFELSSPNPVTFVNHVIAHRDNPKFLDDKPDLKSFKDANDVKERYAVWRDTYKRDYTTKGVFEDAIQPYHIGKDKYSVADLQAISAADQQKKYHEFATILRQHNVSGRENAFDKLVNLFLCKLVDETEHPNELKFYWKGVAYDTHFELLDRLQQLYQAGMGKFLGESITYIDQTAVKNAMRFIKQNPDATQKAVWQLFLQQKFFTNNDFSLIDVHNEKLFYQNAEVLLKILQMWQDIRLTHPGSHNQFLGDMFEGFLDQGVKQSEGQYFTPMPICRFILMSLPLKTLVTQNAAPPKAIDYACGAGHFLNELALQIKPLIDAPSDTSRLAEYHKNIYGIEKEYRLSKVAKVSAFMYGQQDINICYGDALVNQHAAFPEVKDGSFDLLVANPPYSVKGFLETLSEAERKAYHLTDTISDLDTANCIETFFIERAKQLLKAGGVAALILPSSILSNGGNTYVKKREILLQYFDLIAIAEFGSGTFGKTGTNTVTLFLRRKPTAPDTAEHYRERIDEWFKGYNNSKRKQVIYRDAYLIDQYATHIGVSPNDYKTLLAGAPNAALLAHEALAQYRKAFDAKTDTILLKKQKGFIAKSATEQAAELAKRFLEFAHHIERDKLYYFVLASDQPNPVLVIRSPSDTKAQKEFLGYDWSSAKGGEGIKLIKDANGHHRTLLYDESNRDNTAKLNRLIADNFEGKLAAIPTELSDYARTARFADMIDFSRLTSEKQILIAAKSTSPVSSKWPLSPLASLAEVKKGSAITAKSVTKGNVKVVAGGMDFAYLHGLSNRAEHTITVSASGANAGYVNYWREKIFASDCTTIRGETDEHTTYLFYVLQGRQDELFNLAHGAAQPHVNPRNLEPLMIPVVDSVTLKHIVSECETVDAEITAAHNQISKTEHDIVVKIEAFCTTPNNAKPLEEICEIKRGRFTHRPRNDPRFFGGPYPFIQTGDVVRAVAARLPYTQTLNEDGLAVSKLFQPPVVLITIAANIGDTAVLDYPACFTDSVVGLTPKAGIEARFLELMMRSKKKHLNEIAPQMAQKNINVEILKPITVPVPPLAAQHKFVTEIKALEKTIAAAQATLAAAPARKRAIMQRYL